MIMSIAQEKWRGKSSEEVKGHAAQEVWPLLADFCSLHKVFLESKNVTASRELPTSPGQCDTAPGSRPTATIKWAKERLVMIDPIKMCLSYEVIDSNMGFKSYVAVMQVVDKSDDVSSSVIEWSFVLDPNEGGRMEDVQAFGESSLLSIAKRIEHVLASCNLN